LEFRICKRSLLLEGYSSGLRGRFAKPLDRRNASRGFKSHPLRVNEVNEESPANAGLFCVSKNGAGFERRFDAEQSEEERAIPPIQIGVSERKSNRHGP
jgi:hypothetical protein